MLLQTNSYIVPKEKRTEHARLLARFRHALAKLGCDQFECYEQTGTNWAGGESSNRFVQIMRFRDRKHQQQVQQAERTDPTAQQLIREFCELINFPYQQQQGYFAVGFYNSVLPVAALRVASNGNEPPQLPGEVAPVEAPAEALATSEAGQEPASEQPAEPVVEAEIEPELEPLAEDAAADLLNPHPDSDVATADFGDILDLEKDAILDENEEAKPRQPASENPPN